MVHLIFVCKHRKSLLVSMGEDIKVFLRDVAEEQDFGILDMEVDVDHIHVLVEYRPTQSILEIVRYLKQISTYRIWQGKNASELVKHFWKEKTFWSDGYFACSTGQVSKDIIAKYIQTQG